MIPHPRRLVGGAADLIYADLPHSAVLAVDPLLPPVADIETGLTPVTVVVKEPTVMHQVLMKDFERWLKRNGRSPAETASRSALRKQLGL
jgi:hypothetical protein